MILGIDPGMKPGFAVVGGDLHPRGKKKFLAPGVLALGTKPLHRIGEVDLAVVESQWFSPKIKQTGIYKLAFNAGWHLSAANAERKCTAGVQAWKGSLMRNGGSLSKAVFCNRIYAMLTDSEKELVDGFPRGVRMDLLDAIGITWAAYVNPDCLDEIRICC